MVISNSSNHPAEKQSTDSHMEKGQEECKDDLERENSQLKLKLE